MAGAQVWYLLCLVVEHVWFPDWENDESNAAAAFAVLAGVNGLLLLIATVLGVVGYLLWIHRATRNSLALGGGSSNATPLMAVVYWFIPIVNLLRPYQVVRALYETSAPEGPPTDPASRWTWSFPVWWGTWLVGSILNNRSARLSFSDDPAVRASALPLELALTPLVVVSAALAVMILWSIEARHRHLAESSNQSADRLRSGAHHDGGLRVGG